MTRNISQIIAVQEEARRLYKSKWTTSTCEEQGQRLHDLIKEGYIKKKGPTWEDNHLYVKEIKPLQLQN